MRARAEAITRVCFDAEPREEDLALLGARERWMLYRSLVRSRLVKVLRTALPRTHAAMPEGAFDALAAGFLAVDPPRTRFFWQVPLAFGEYAGSRLPDAPAHLADLFRYELACWRVRQKPVEAEEAGEFAFERVPLLHPTVEVVALEHAVHLLEPGAAATVQPTRVCVYRNTKEAVEALRLNPMAHALVEDWLTGRRTVADSVRRVAAARGVAIDQSFLEKLGALIADLLERRVLLGSKI